MRSDLAHVASATVAFEAALPCAALVSAAAAHPLLAACEAQRQPA
jgi:hypothetical protein